MAHFILFFFSILAWANAAANFSIPAAWTSHLPQTLTRDERVARAQAGLNVMVNDYYQNSTGTFAGLPFYDTGRLHWTLAMQDYVSGTTQNQFVPTALSTVDLSQVRLSVSCRQYASPFTQPSADDVAVFVYYALAATYAYRAYHVESMLDMAVHLWQNVSQYQISMSQAVTGKHPLKPNYTFSSTCLSSRNSVTGAVFVDFAPDSFVFNTDATGGVMLLSAHLAELTSNTTFLSAAISAAQFISTVMLDPFSGLVYNSGQLGNGTVECSVTPPYNPLSPQLTGVYIEGLAVLADVDTTSASQWTNLMMNAIQAATNNSVWFKPGGSVLNFPQNSGATTDTIDDASYNGRLVQSLYAPWVRSNDSDLQAYIGAFMNVQANSIQTLALNNASTLYASTWQGPPPSQFDWGGQISATSALVGAIGAAAPSSSSSSPSSSSSAISSSANASSISPPSPQSSSLPLALGLGLGLTVAAVLLVLLVLFLRRRRRRHPADVIEANRSKEKRAVDLLAAAAALPLAASHQLALSPPRARPATLAAGGKGDLGSLGSLPPGLGSPSPLPRGASGSNGVAPLAVATVDEDLLEHNTPFVWKGRPPADADRSKKLRAPSSAAATPRLPPARPTADEVDTPELLRVLRERGMIAVAHEPHEPHEPPPEYDGGD